MRIILTKLGPKGVANLGCVSHYFQYWASDDFIWSQFCAQELHLYSPEDPFGNTTRSFKVLKIYCFYVLSIFAICFLCNCYTSTCISYIAALPR